MMLPTNYIRPHGDTCTETKEIKLELFQRTVQLGPKSCFIPSAVLMVMAWQRPRNEGLPEVLGFGERIPIVPLRTFEDRMG